MENKKTIKFLNNKVWYRLLKTLFIFGIIGALGIFNFIVFSNGVKKINQNKTIIYCVQKPSNDPNKFAQDFYNQRKDSFSAEEAKLFLDKNDFKDKKINMTNITNTYVFTKIIRKCLPPDISTQALSIKQYQNYFGSKITDIEIIPVFTYLPFLKLFFIGNILILLGFEVIRRSFYYIVLGSINPKNNKN